MEVMDIYRDTAKYKNPSILIKDRISFIKKLAYNQVVLDVGCVDHNSEQEEKLGEFWLHRAIKDVAAEITGVDFEEEEVKKLNKKG